LSLAVVRLPQVASTCDSGFTTFFDGDGEGIYVMFIFLKKKMLFLSGFVLGFVIGMLIFQE